MEGASYAGLFRGDDTFYNSVNLFSNIMQSIESYIIEENNPALPFCMDILKTLISQINSFVDPIKTYIIYVTAKFFYYNVFKPSIITNFFFAAIFTKCVLKEPTFLQYTISFNT